MDGVDDADFIQFETKQQLCELVSIFGETILCNVQKRVKCGEPKMLKALDTMNIIVGSRTAEDPFKWYTENDGVDFLFNGTNTLCISIWYWQYVYLPSKHVPWRYLE